MSHHSKPLAIAARKTESQLGMRFLGSRSWSKSAVIRQRRRDSSGGSFLVKKDREPFRLRKQTAVRQKRNAMRVASGNREGNCTHEWLRDSIAELASWRDGIRLERSIGAPTLGGVRRSRLIINVAKIGGVREWRGRAEEKNEKLGQSKSSAQACRGSSSPPGLFPEKVIATAVRDQLWVWRAEAYEFFCRIQWGGAWGRSNERDRIQWGLRSRGPVNKD